MRRLLCLALLLCASLASAAEAPLFNADGYRSARYRAPLPATVDGATALDTAGLRALLAQEPVVLVDVYAAARQPADGTLDATWLVPQPRQSLPGSTWLPNVGYGELDPTVAAYFRDHLARLTSGDPTRPLVIFCVVDCWMSWNAVRRAAALGYRRLYWYREGTDGWQAAGLPLAAVQAEPLRE
jgi:PQQ-dependent catabolism-associated CXXCW motif protein